MTAVEPDPAAAGAPEVHAVLGRDVTLPVEVRAATMVVGQWLVDADAAQRVIDHTGLRVVRQRGGRAICSISGVRYLDNDLGTYNELAVAFVVHPHDDPDGKPSMTSPTTYIHKLPVDGEFTCAAGQQIWGFPKWVTRLDYTERDRRTEVVLVDDDELVVGLSIARSHLPLPARDLPMQCYSFREGVLRRTPWTTRNEQTHARVGGAVLELGTRHPIALELRSLGLPKRALMTMTVDHLTATFGAAEVVEPD